MRVSYDPTADAIYLYLTERAPESPEIARTEEVAAGVMLDLDSAGRVTGIEVLSVSTLAGARPMQIVFEILTRSDAAAAEQNLSRR